jgi:hypothetical protein
MIDTELFWLNVANIAFGAAVLAFVLIVLYGTLQEVVRRHGSRSS